MSDQVTELKNTLDAVLQSEKDMEARVGALVEDLKNHPAAPDLTDLIAEASAIQASLGNFEVPAPVVVAPDPTPVADPAPVVADPGVTVIDPSAPTS